MKVPEIAIIAQQFNGPNHSGNGGYVSGMVGDRLAPRTGGAPVTVTLRKPPPLGLPLAWRDASGSVQLLDGDHLIAEAGPGTFGDHLPVETVSLADAEQAMRDFEGYVDHPFPRCYTCGSDREPGDGLRVFSGPLPDGRMACPWQPHAAFCDDGGQLTAPNVWAALDCPGGWAAHIKAHPMVLGRMTASINYRPAEGEPCLIVGELRAVHGRKNHTATTIYGAGGDIVGRAEQTWITIDIEAFS